MIGGDNVNRAFVQCLPESLIVVRRFDAGVHLNPSPQSGIVVDIEEQMVRTRFRRDPIRTLPQKSPPRRRLTHAIHETDADVGSPNQWPDAWRLPPRGDLESFEWTATSCSPANRWALARTVDSSSQCAVIGNVVCSKMRLQGVLIVYQ